MKPITKLDTPCREWQGARTGPSKDRREQYGCRDGEITKIVTSKRGWRSIYRKKVMVHKWVWEQINGPVPSGMVVMHLCDNPPCFRYDHLRIGTIGDNIRDAAAKGRIPTRVGELSPMAKLTQAQVDEIRASPSVTTRAFARRFGMSSTAIFCARTGKTWGPL